MSFNQEDILKELMGDFRIEAKEHYEAIINGLISLESNLNTSDVKEQVEVLFRETHSLKGASRAVSLSSIEQICMEIEGVFHAIKNGELKLSMEHFEALFFATDLLEKAIEDVENNTKSLKESDLILCSKKLSKIVKGEDKAFSFSLLEENDSDSMESVSDKEKEERPRQQSIPKEKTEQKPTSSTKDIDTIRVSIDKLNLLLQQGEEFINLKTMLTFQNKLISNLSSKFNHWKKNDAAFNGKELDWIKNLESDISGLATDMEKITKIAHREIDELNFKIKQTMMQPFSSLFNIIPKIVRDLSANNNIQIDLIIEGNEIEIDRRILEQMKDPLIHLIRNCLSHGIENIDERSKAGKDKKGKLEIIAEQNAKEIILRIKDDGRGLNRSKIVKSAIDKGLITQAEAEKMDDSEVFKLIFSSGVSTSDFITDISGRGLGMAIVAENIQSVGGKINVDSKANEGTEFLIQLPSSIATFRGILVESCGKQFIIPTKGIVKAQHIKPEDIKTIEGKEVIKFQNRHIGISTLATPLNLKGKPIQISKESKLKTLVLESRKQLFCFIVDDIFGEQEGVVKNLGSQLQHVNCIAGSTLLGNGKLIPILHVEELLQSSYKSRTIKPKHEVEEEEKESLRILVADDSITVRNMIKSIVEGAGYKVETAINGEEALQALQNDEFDLLVSDVEMPKMNGFELTEAVRKNNQLKHLPIIIVTSLESSGDRRKGMEAGANAYIVKGNFEQSNLIETIEQLI